MLTNQSSKANGYWLKENHIPLYSEPKESFCPFSFYLYTNRRTVALYTRIPEDAPTFIS